MTLDERLALMARIHAIVVRLDLRLYSGVGVRLLEVNELVFQSRPPTDVCRLAASTAARLRAGAAVMEQLAAELTEIANEMRGPAPRNVVLA